MALFFAGTKIRASYLNSIDYAGVWQNGTSNIAIGTSAVALWEIVIADPGWAYKYKVTSLSLYATGLTTNALLTMQLWESAITTGTNVFNGFKVAAGANDCLFMPSYTSPSKTGPTTLWVAGLVSTGTGAANSVSNAQTTQFDVMVRAA